MMSCFCGMINRRKRQALLACRTISKEFHYSKPSQTLNMIKTCVEPEFRLKCMMVYSSDLTTQHRPKSVNWYLYFEIRAFVYYSRIFGFILYLHISSTFGLALFLAKKVSSFIKFCIIFHISLLFRLYQYRSVY